MNYIQQYNEANNLLLQIKQNLINDLKQEFETNVKPNFVKQGGLTLIPYKNLTTSWSYDEVSGKQLESDFNDMCGMILRTKDLEKTLHNILKYKTIRNYKRNCGTFFEINGVYKGFYKKIDEKLLGIVKKYL